ncbi:gustatory receptor for sugar taste 64a-like [Ochlerotatus camptorhynchus]|uniref:gustatory receptor for sugar taste 64a-like n=1 Tax=Ochlerotatus camptorhynchus TaxID=644619 RepID=UPI0031D309C6
MAAVEIRGLIRSGINFSNIIGVYFFIDTSVIVSLMVQMASNWSQFLTEIDKVELVLQQKSYNPLKVRLNVNCWRMAAGWIVLGTVEHLFATFNGVYIQYREWLRCNKVYSYTMEVYARRRFAYIFNWMPYNIPVYFFAHYVIYAVTMAWTYQDVLIMVISMYVIARYRQFFGRVEAAGPQQEPFWMEIREHYVMLSEFLEKVDQLLSPLVISSCWNNIFLICYQLLHSLEQNRFAISFVYCCYSLGFLIGRTWTTLLMAANLNREIRSARRAVHRIPSEYWCTDLERYYLQLRVEVGALSGKRFFYLTHRTVFTIVALIFTYELVMLKYSRLEAVAEVSGNCSAMDLSQAD